MADWTEEREQAKRDIEESGTSIIIRAYTRGTYNPISDLYSSFSSSDTLTKAIILNYKKGDIDGTLIKKGDRQLLIHAINIPLLDELESFSIIYNSKKYSSNLVETLKPGGTPILYKVQIRG